MKCENCESSLRSGLKLECVRCGLYMHDCPCAAQIGYTPDRIVHCTTCNRDHIKQISTSKSGWRSNTI